MNTFEKDRTFWSIWLIALFVKSALAILLPMSNDEAYYWVWGHHPELSYFDHPPMVGWLFALGTWVENFGNAARLPGVWLGHLTLVIWMKILAPFITQRQKSLWLIFVLFSPFLGLGSLVITPDVPLLFFWSLSLLLLLRAVEKPGAAIYLALGASLGLGFCSKYMIVLFVPIAIAWLAWSGEWRKVRWQLVPLTILAGLIFCTPVLYWNWTHDWASIQFQLAHGFKSDKRDLTWPLAYAAGQFGILFPTVFIAALLCREPKGARFLRFFGWGPLLFFLYTSFKAPVEANWPIMGHPALLSLGFLNFRDGRLIKATVAIWIIALVVVVTEITTHWLPVDRSKLKTSEFTKFDVFLPEIGSGKHPDRPLYLGSYQMAATVSYKLRRQVYKLGGLNRKDFYDFIPQSYPQHASFRIGAEASLPLPAWLKEQGYEVTGTQRLTDEFHILEVSKSAQGSGR